MNNKVILAVGVVSGFILAAFGALAPTIEDLSTGMVARVNGKTITAEELATKSKEVRRKTWT